MQDKYFDTKLIWDLLLGFGIGRATVLKIDGNWIEKVRSRKYSLSFTHGDPEHDYYSFQLQQPGSYQLPRYANWRINFIK